MRKRIIMKLQAEYIWLDGAEPTQELRSKTRIVELSGSQKVNPDELPVWSFDGSSTYQASGNSSDLYLMPVQVVFDPLRGNNNYLVLCEVYGEDGKPHKTNTRAKLREILSNGASELDPLFGFEQEYTLFHGRSPLGWPEGGFPAPQGPFYCGVGANKVYGRKIVEKHTQACLDADLLLYGTNAEVMPGQWEFQIGHRNFINESGDPLTVSDHLWIARWLLLRIAEDDNIVPSFDNKPVSGDWNGAGAHTNFSTKSMREEGGLQAIESAIEKLSKKHDEHIDVYGAGLSERLTGAHETCSITEFKSGMADRSASIRIPRHVAEQGHGYLEDRRPGANCDPYAVCTAILNTVLDR